MGASRRPPLTILRFYTSAPLPIAIYHTTARPVEHHHLCRHPSLMDDYTWWFDEWGSWDLYSPIVSEIDEDIEELLLVYGLLFGEYCHQRNISSSIYV